jgi:subtilisin family serine protease
VNAITTKTEEETQLKEGLLEIANSVEGKTMDEIMAMVSSQIDEAKKHYKDELDFSLNENFEPRTIVGDNYANKTERIYGNNDVEGPDAFHGTHVAGIVGAVRNNGKGMDGIAGDVAKIMSVRVVPNGDERDKDIANAIRYAVDNGAKVINMSFGKAYSPEADLVWAAMKYAQKKNILLVHGAGNDNLNIDTLIHYPTPYKIGKKKPFVNNCITVGASTMDNGALKADYSNYGTHVDLFAPGSTIYSTIPDNTYKDADGTSMASPVVAGCASLLWAYFPHLTPKQVKEILMATVDKNDDTVVLSKDRKGNKRTTTFSKISTAGGTINVYKAVQLAYEKYNK